MLNMKTCKYKMAGSFKEGYFGRRKGERGN